jgi:hypothetical protein
MPAVWLSTRPNFALTEVWYLSVATVTLQALTSLALLQREFRRRLGAPPGTVTGLNRPAV